MHQVDVAQLSQYFFISAPKPKDFDARDFTGFDIADIRAHTVFLCGNNFYILRNFRIAYNVQYTDVVFVGNSPSMALNKITIGRKHIRREPTTQK